EGGSDRERGSSDLRGVFDGRRRLVRNVAPTEVSRSGNSVVVSPVPASPALRSVRAAGSGCWKVPTSGRRPWGDPGTAPGATGRSGSPPSLPPIPSASWSPAGGPAGGPPTALSRALRRLPGASPPSPPAPPRGGAPRRPPRRLAPPSPPVTIALDGIVSSLESHLPGYKGPKESPRARLG